MNKRKVSIITLGCKVNQYESNSIAKALLDIGFDVSLSLCDADAYILNTCAVTNEAERKSRGMLAKIDKVNSTAPIFVCGCSAQNNADKFLSHKNVKAVYGTGAKYELVDLVKAFFKKPLLTATHNEISTSYEDNYIAGGERTRTVIKIQDGCNNFCSYCLIPYIRGRERSRSLASVKEEVTYQAKLTKEIVFTGINLSAYGKDLEENVSLKDVALMMREFPNVRFRFSSLEQEIITEDFLKVLKDTPSFCPHFHLSLQSGCDRTLKDMHRKYTSSEYLKKIELIRKYFDNPAITTDIIVGFPTETDEDANETFEFAKKCKFAKMHIFPYSVRSGTVAAKLKNIATNVKERVKRLSDLDKQLFKEYIESNISKTMDIIVETFEDGYYIGHTKNYIKCYVEAEKPLSQNSLVNVKIVKFFKDGAIAEEVSC